LIYLSSFNQTVDLEQGYREAFFSFIQDYDKSYKDEIDMSLRYE